MVEEGMFGALLGSRYLTEDVGGLCRPCGSRHVCSSVLAGLWGAASLLEGRVHRWFAAQYDGGGHAYGVVWALGGSLKSQVIA